MAAYMADFAFEDSFSTISNILQPALNWQHTLMDKSPSFEWVYARICDHSLWVSYLASISTCLALATLAFLYQYGTRNPKTIAKARPILCALISVVTPTQSIWPSKYPALAYSTARWSSSCLYLPLSTLYDDLLEGRVELRNPRKHLPLLFINSLSVHGISIKLDVDGRWKYSTALRTWSSDRSGQAEDVQSAITATVIGNASRAGEAIEYMPSSSGLRPLSIPPSWRFLHTLSLDVPAIALDCLPNCHGLENISKLLEPGAPLLIGLTCLSSSSDSDDTRKSYLTQVPFLPRKQPTDHPQTRSNSLAMLQRACTPLTSSLADVLKTLTSGPVRYTVEIVRNVSDEYAEFLHEYIQELEGDAAVRSAFVGEWGMQAWNEERLRAAWEAALVEVGWLESWAILVYKQECV